jgi:D-amino peptidase
MRVVIVFDMEGTSHIGDFRELCPIFPEYWDIGRAKLTNDVAAAARGLLAGGATEVVVMNHHGAGEVEWPNVVPEDLPDGVTIVEWDKLAMRSEVDAMFQVGAHARGGRRACTRR